MNHSKHPVPTYAKLRYEEKSNLKFCDFSVFFGILNKDGYSVYDVETDLVKDGVSIFSYPPTFVLGEHIHYNYPPHMNKNTTRECFDDLELMKHTANLWLIHVGHNLPYDMNALEMTPNRDCFYWDTSVAQYLLTNQEMTYPSLQDSCAYYKIPMLKEDKVSQMIKAGVEPKDIPKDLLKEYLHQDVDMTNALFLAQLDDVVSRPRAFRNLFLQQMQWRKNTYSISKTGMQLDTPRIAASIADMQIKSRVLEIKLLEQMDEHFEKYFSDSIKKQAWTYKNELSLQSPKQIATYLYGGSVDVQYSTMIGTYKTGPKAGTTKVKITTVNQLTVGNLSKDGDNSTDDKKLLAICNSPSTPKHVIDFCRGLLEYRNITKTLNTYFVGYSQHIDNEGKIHPQFNHTATPTGRLTCTKPNTQNLKGDE